MTATQNQQVGRRTFVKGIGATAAAGVGLASTRGPVGQAQAIPPIVIGGAAAGASAAFGWALREFEVIGSDSPPEGLTLEALNDRIHQTARTRKSTNASTILDNENIVTGMEHVAYTEAKIDAIHALNEQLSQSDVQEAAIDAIDSYEDTILTNLLESWNESAKEVDFLFNAQLDHPDTPTELDDYSTIDSREEALISAFSDETISHELPSGSELDVQIVTHYVSSGGSGSRPAWTPFDPDLGDDTSVSRAALTYDYGETDTVVSYLEYDDWNPIYEHIVDTMSDVRDSMILWVENVYSDVQSGEIDVEELITPRERAAMMSEDEGMAQAIADLQALNIPIDVEREATIHLPHVDATIRGTLGITQDQSIESGETYDPDEDIDGSAYLTYDVSLGEGTWSAYEDGVDGGEVTFTDEPWPGTIYQIDTTAGETVELAEDDFTAVDDDGDEVEDWEDPDRWIVDISDDVETGITEIDEVAYFPAEDETQFETIQLQEEFTVERIEDTSTGEEADSMEFESSEPQSDDNYITQEEWDELEEQNQELIEMYEESQSDGIGIGFGFLDGDSNLGLLAIVGLAGLVAWEVLTN